MHWAEKALGTKIGLQLYRNRQLHAPQHCTSSLHCSKPRCGMEHMYSCTMQEWYDVVVYVIIYFFTSITLSCFHYLFFFTLCIHGFHTVTSQHFHFCKMFLMLVSFLSCFQYNNVDTQPLHGYGIFTVPVAVMPRFFQVIAVP